MKAYIPELWDREWEKLFSEQSPFEKLVEEPMNNRKGILRIDASNLFDSQLIFAEVIIVRCEYMAMTDRYVYDCYSKHFRPVEPGYKIPEYEVIIHEDRDDPTIEFLEVKE